MARLRIPVKIRWSDIDGYGHVNNAAVLTLLEEARIAAFWHGSAGLVAGSEDGEAAEPGDGANVLDAGHGASTYTFIAHQEIEYLAPLGYRAEPLQVELWLARIGGASLDVCYEVPGPDGVAVRAMTTLVTVDPATTRPRRITDAERNAWAPLVEGPVSFRRDLAR